MRCVKLVVDSTNRMLFIFQTLPSILGMARFHLSLGLASRPASGGIPVATSLGGKAHRGMSVPRPHTAFSLCPQPINTESAPKNVVDAVSGCGRAWWQGAAWGGGAGERKMDLGKVNRCVWGHPSGVDMGNLGEVAGRRVTVGSLRVWKWIAGELGKQSGRGGGGSRVRPVVRCGFLDYIWRN